MLRAWWPLLICLLLLTPVPAQETEANAAFVAAVLRKVFSNDGPGAAQLILGDRPRAREAFQVLVVGYPSLTDPKQQMMAKGYLNTVARVFEANGDGDLVKQLRAEGLLAEATAAPPAPSPSPPATQKSNTVSELVDLYLTASSKAFRFGNFQAANRVLTSLGEFLTSLGKVMPEAGPQLRGVEQGQSVLMLATTVFSGMASGSIPVGESLLRITTGKEQFVTRMLLIEAARRAARPQLVDQQLPLLLGELPAYAADESTPVWLFAARSFAFERELQKNPDLPVDTLVKRHEEAWKAIATYRVAEDSMGDGRIFWDAVRIWTTELSRRLLTSSAGPGRSQLKSLYDRDLTEGQRIANTSIQVKAPKNFNPEYMTGLFDFVLDSIEAATHVGRYADARELLSTLDPIVSQYQKIFGETESQHRKDMTLAVQVFETTIGPTLRQTGLAASGKAFDYSLLEGDVARIQGRLHQVKVRLLMAESQGKLTPDQVSLIKQELTAATQAQAQAIRGQGSLGMDDINWDLLQVLFARKSPGWEADASRLLELLQQAALMLNDRPALIAGYTYQGELKASRGDKPGAIVDLKKSTALAEEYITEVGATASGASQIRERYRRAYDLLTRLQLETGKPQEAYDTLGRLQQMEALSASAGTLESNPVLARAVTLRGQTQALQQEIATQKATGQDARPAEQLLARTKGEFFTALNEIRRTNPNYESMLGIRPVNFSKQQGSIPANAAIVQYFPSGEALYIFLVTRDELKIHKVEIKEVELRAELTRLRQAIMSRGDLTASATRLHGILVDPIEKDVANKPLLAFIPTGALNYLPFPALARKKGERLEFLAERKQCAALLKSSDLDQLSHSPASSKGQLLALGNPDGSLPAATTEVQEIAGLFGGKPFVGKEASRERLKALERGGIAYLHLATHGTLDSRDPAASYLLMAGQADSSRLLVPQIYELKLAGVRLVTLSACQTALGEREPGSELQTLADAFAVAGTNSVVASFWSVADDSTRTLMVEFYKQLKEGKPLALALNGAQLSLLKNPKFSHPFYWAPFVLIGDWR